MLIHIYFALANSVFNGIYKLYSNLPNYCPSGSLIST
uniref:Uncharacterized protein n=1 Tax=Anguilla anguilla TaxID=7936 RepID=A0A0E9SSF1_ANGAN